MVDSGARGVLLFGDGGCLILSEVGVCGVLVFGLVGLWLCWVWYAVMVVFGLVAC